MTSSTDIVRPFLGWTILEPARLAFEMSALAALYPMLGTVPRGDGHPVLVLPGFATNDQMTVLLRTYLTHLGYSVHGWDLGWNLDQHTIGENGEHLADRIAQIRADRGRKVSLVGWSLGGVIARAAARQDPNDVRQVIALGSPFTGNPEATNLNNLYELLTGNVVSEMKGHTRYAKGHHPLKVPSTAIYSKTDGITAWENCISETDDITENIEVWSSHFGFVANPAVFYAVADRLALPRGEWSPFEYGGPFRSFYFTGN
ncbi:esterase/lipase family protein [Novosphingobium marinum]|uniref:Pimeloyl-ACP methyl ester carboxylesterase n=1 Tax=Novosphingobium marinum TaxID=1514948 RepID=A0A7Z0BRD5_9SPHN|nr:alpha/beta hydrolase [Novosphingobium marinum]NYH93741.1 pimeloyl-ACP methyl ester carboxylesterase [Novosphingobium marinum]